MLGLIHALPLDGAARVSPVAPNRTGSKPLMEALALRHFERQFATAQLLEQPLSDLL